MDGEHFDRIARQFARSTSRRRFIGGLLGGALTGLGLGTTSAQGACSRDNPIRCGTDCVDLRTNPEHCGRCNRVCAAGDVCYAGRCSRQCPRGFVPCNGTCVRACPSGQQLNESTCECGGCVPTSCSAEGAECGVISDGCGGTPNCGPCEDVISCDSSVDCADLDDDCNIGVCNSSTGECEIEPANEGDLCDDGDLCTENATCTATGTCVGAAKDCTALDGECVIGVCNVTTGDCEAFPDSEGEPCGDGGTCQGGTCESASSTCADTCDGCCSGVTCHPGTENTLCGSGGNACANCGTGTCINQACFSPDAPAPQECNASNCPGCCDGTTCVNPPTHQRCGNQGNACITCGICQFCDSATGACGQDPSPECN